ncbi:hypothetical protein BTZ20_5570 [Rhodococcus sp. MTM3W5.2]|nr:hypothetical protein BTZ20_5570 [Rhodococcus sp. MTM3W5.2]
MSSPVPGLCPGRCTLGGSGRQLMVSRTSWWALASPRGYNMQPIGCMLGR